ncbi:MULTISPECIES: FUSC family protein [Streptomyces]|uniref:FUSC family protein n=1 Tax=Streptomyces TaxID=1883 RepID=UPI0012FEE243|nr:MULTISPECIES: FUSC family protein [Streptomyces]
MSSPDAVSWWARAVRPARPPLPLALMARAAVGMAVPLAAGLSAHRLDLGVFAGLGAMHATMNDRVEPSRLRAVRIGTAVFASALGMLIGTALQRADVDGLALGAALTLTAFVSGALSATGPRGSAAGMLLLVSAALGSGMPLPDPWWAAAPMMLAGAVLVVLLGLPAGVPKRPAADPRVRALAAAYDALGRTLADLGTSRAAGSRQVLTARLNQLQDLLPNQSRSRRRSRNPSRNPNEGPSRNPNEGPSRSRHTEPRTRRMYEAALAATEAATGLLWARRAVPPEVAGVPARLAAAVRRGGGEVVVPDWQPDTPSRQALDVALRAAADTVAGRDAQLGTAPAPPPDPWRLRVRLLSGGSVRYGLRVALCIAVGSAVTANFPLSKSYWVPMTIAFVLKPDLGSVFLRAVSRSIGTVLGVVVTAALLVLTTEHWALTAVAALCVALLPYATAAHYGLNTVVMTPMALVLLQLGGQSSAAEFWPRVLDTVLASAIVLLFGYLLWPERPRHRIEPRLVDATRALRAYLDAVTAVPGPAGAHRADRAEVWLRRTAYRSLADARQEVRQGLAEPPPTGRLAEQWLPATAALERLGGAVAAFAAQIRYGGRVPDPDEVDRVRRALDELTAAARAHRPPTTPPAATTPPAPTDRPTKPTEPPEPHDPTRSALGRAADELEALLTNS